VAGVSVRNILGSQNYDVEINGFSLDYLEMSSADFEVEEYFRGEELITHGEVCLTSPAIRNQEGRVIGIEPGTWSALHDDLIAQRAGRIRNRIEAKSAKSYRPRTGLVVQFHDGLHPDDDDRVFYSALVEDTRTVWETNFDRLYLVGHYGKLNQGTHKELERAP
jgi:hypothetical protein